MTITHCLWARAAWVVLTMLALGILVAGGCSGDLASISGSPVGRFDVTSSAFSLSAGDEISVTYSVAPANEASGSSYIVARLVGPNGRGQLIVSTTGSDSDALDWTMRHGGTCYLEAVGRNMVYSVSVSKSSE